MNAKTHDTALDDLSYIRTLAEEGRKAPFIGGRIGLMWGVLLVITLTLHGLSSFNMLGFSIENIGLLWLAFGIIGTVLTGVLGRSLKNKPGKNAVNNRVEHSVWTASAIAIFTIALSIAGSVMKNGYPYWLFDMIMALAFATYFINYFVLAKISGNKALFIPSYISLALSALMIVMLGNPIVYFLAAIGVVFTLILPALSDIKKEPKDVV